MREILGIPSHGGVIASILEHVPLVKKIVAPPFLAEVPNLEDVPTPLERAQFLLQIAAEVEHSLLVQYLYAAFSLGPPFGGSPPANANTLARNWSQTLLQIAREEMGHLLTIQNLLRLLRLAPNLEREDLPRHDLYPFPLELEPFAVPALSKYIAAEMPEIAEPDPDLAQIIADAKADAGADIHRVGVVYALLIGIFSRPEASPQASDADPWEAWVGAVNEAAQNDLHLPDDAFDASSAAHQATPDDWGGNSQVFVDVVTTRDEALASLDRIARQGEAAGPSPSPAQSSHYVRFRAVHDAFPLDGSWRPSLPASTNPTLASIANVRSRQWAELADVRYAILLASIDHFLRLEGPLYLSSGAEIGDRTPRGYLHLWAFDEMRRVGKFGRKLARMPNDNAADPPRAGIPFTFPSIIPLPATDAARWQIHVDLYTRAQTIVTQLLSGVDTDDPFLRHLLQSDAVSIDIAGSQANGAAPPPQPRGFRKAVTILDEAVHGMNVGVHGPFWRNRTRDDFVAEADTIAPDGNGLSTVLLAIRGELPFDPRSQPPLANPMADYPRMPRGRPPVPPPRVAFLETWIQNGAPDDSPPNQIGIVGEPDPKPE